MSQNNQQNDALPGVSGAAAEEGRDAFDSLDDGVLESMNADKGAEGSEEVEQKGDEQVEDGAAGQESEQKPEDDEVAAKPPAEGEQQQKPKEPVQEQPKQPEVPAEVKPETAEEKAAREQRVREADEAEIATLAQQYQLTEEEAEKMLLEPGNIVPSFAARLHHNIVKQVLAQLPQQVPQLVQQHTQVAERNRQATEAFYAPWKGKLDPTNPVHDRTVLTIGAQWRQRNPNATPEEAVQKIGQLACVELGIPVEAAAPPPKPTAPHRPTAPGGSAFTPTLTQSPDANGWGDLAGERGS